MITMTTVFSSDLFLLFFQVVMSWILPLGTIQTDVFFYSYVHILYLKLKPHYA